VYFLYDAAHGRTGSSKCEPLKIRFSFLSYYHLIPSHHLHIFYYQLRLHFRHDFHYPSLTGFNTIVHEEVIIIQLANKFPVVYCGVDNSPSQDPLLSRMSSVCIFITCRAFFKFHCVVPLPPTPRLLSLTFSYYNFSFVAITTTTTTTTTTTFFILFLDKKKSDFRIVRFCSVRVCC